MSYTLESLKEWIDELYSILPKDTKIIIAKDSEGNDYSPMCNFNRGYYYPNSSWSGSVYFASHKAEDYDMTEAEWKDIQAESNSCIILWPTN